MSNKALLQIRPSIQIDTFNHPYAFKLLSQHEGKALSALCASLLERGAKAAASVDTWVNVAPTVAGVSLPATASVALPAEPDTPSTNRGDSPLDSHGTPPMDAMRDFLSLPSAID